MKRLSKNVLAVLLSVTILFSISVVSYADQSTAKEDLKNWISAADTLLRQQKNYVEGLETFKAAVNSAKSDLYLSNADFSQDIASIKTAWAGLKYSATAEIAPSVEVGGIAAVTNKEMFNYNNFGKYGAKGNGSWIVLKYDLKSVDARLRTGDVSNAYVYAYAYSETGTAKAVSGTNLPAGTNVNENNVFLTTQDYGVDGNWTHAGIFNITYDRVTRCEWTAENLGQLNAERDYFNLREGKGAENTYYFGSLFIEYSIYESVPVNAEAARWTFLAKELLTEQNNVNGKYYTSDTETAFKTAVAELENAEATNASAKIEALKTAWAALKYIKSEEIAKPEIYSGASLYNPDGYDYSRDKIGTALSVSSNWNQSIIKFVMPTDLTPEKIDSAVSVYYSIKGSLKDTPDSGPAGWTLTYKNASAYDRDTATYIGGGPGANPHYQVYSMEKNCLIDNGNPIKAYFLQFDNVDKASAWVIGGIFMDTYAYEMLPNVLTGRMKVWADRADALLEAKGDSYTGGLEEFKAALESLKAGSKENEDELIYNLKYAWNNLIYRETVLLGMPAAEIGIDVTQTEAITDFGDQNHISVMCKDGITIRFDFAVFRAPSFFDNVIEVYAEVKGSKAGEPDSTSSATWANVNGIKTDGNYPYFGAIDFVGAQKSKKQFNLDTVKTAFAEGELKGWLVKAEGCELDDVWSVGNLYAVVENKEKLFEPGDVNGDSSVNIIDLIKLKKHFAYDDKINEMAADISEDGFIASDDMISLRKILLDIDAFGDNVVNESKVF